jgi:hypothetical protein
MDFIFILSFIKEKATVAREVASLMRRIAFDDIILFLIRCQKIYRSMDYYKKAFVCLPSYPAAGGTYLVFILNPESSIKYADR